MNTAFAPIRSSHGKDFSRSGGPIGSGMPRWSTSRGHQPMRQIPNLFLAVAMSVGAPGLVFSQICPSDCAAPCLSTAPCASYEAPACQGCAPTPTCETRTVSRPFFSWQKIQINTLDRAREKCSSCPCPQTYCQPQAVMAMPQIGTFSYLPIPITISLCWAAAAFFKALGTSVIVAKIFNHWGC